MGKIGRTPLDAIARKAADKIRHSRGARAVCVDTDGRVTVERWADAVPSDVAGNYNRDMGWPALELAVRDDVKALLSERRRSA